MREGSGRDAGRIREGRGRNAGGTREGCGRGSGRDAVGTREGSGRDAGAHRAQRLLQAEAAGVDPALGPRGDLDEVAALHQLCLPTGLGRFCEALPGEGGVMGGAGVRAGSPSTQRDLGEGCIPHRAPCRPREQAPRDAQGLAESCPVSPVTVSRR